MSHPVCLLFDGHQMVFIPLCTRIGSPRQNCVEDPKTGLKNSESAHNNRDLNRIGHVDIVAHFILLPDFWYRVFLMASELALLLAISFRGERRFLLAWYLLVSLTSAASYGWYEHLFGFMAAVSDIGKLLLFLQAWLLATQGLWGGQRLRFAAGCIAAGFVPMCAAIEMRHPPGFIGFHTHYLLWIAGACSMIPVWLGQFDVWTDSETRTHVRMVALLMLPKALAVLAQAQPYVALPFWGVNIACEIALAAVLLLWTAKVLRQPRRHHREDYEECPPRKWAPGPRALSVYHAPPTSPAGH